MPTYYYTGLPKRRLGEHTVCACAESRDIGKIWVGASGICTHEPNFVTEPVSARGVVNRRVVHKREVCAFQVPL